jgi:hypothetical protein
LEMDKIGGQRMGIRENETKIVVTKPKELKI